MKSDQSSKKNQIQNNNQTLTKLSTSGSQRYSAKQKFETVWKYVLFLITVVSLFLIKKIYEYQTLDSLKQIRKGHLSELLLYGGFFAFFFIMGEELAHGKFDRQCEMKFICWKMYPITQKRQFRSFMIVKWGWNVLYYIVSVIWGYMVLKDTSIMPAILGGKGQCTDISHSINSFTESTSAMQILYIIHFGRHFGKLIQHCFIKSEGLFYQFALHHGLSTFLIFFSYLMNFWLMGLFVLLIHDFSDIFLIVPRVMRDGRETKHMKKLMIIVDYMGGIAWVGCRILLLSGCCIYSGINLLSQFTFRPDRFNPEIVNLVYYPIFFMTFMLSALQIVQLYWTYFIARAFVGSNISEKIQSNQYDD